MSEPARPGHPALVIRPGRHEDLSSLVRIYNHYVSSSHVTFDTQPFSVEEREPWFGQFASSGPYRLVVAERAGEVIGYASSTPFKDKAAYAISVETAIYLDPECLGLGVAYRLYTVLLESLESEDVHRAYAAIALPNPASVSVHEKLGFEHVGTLTQAGRKFGKLWDIAIWEKRIGGLTRAR